MSIAVFLSTVTDEFRPYRDQLAGDLTRHNVAVKVQEDFKGLGGDTLDKLDVYIAHCDAVVHLVGDMTCAAPAAAEVAALLRKHPDLPTKLPPLGDVPRDGTAVSYTQWEAWLTLHHGKLLLTAKAEPHAPRDDRHVPTDGSRAAQAAHLGRLAQVKRSPDCTFANAADLARHIAYTAILDLLVKDYARQAAAERDVAQGFIGEMAGRVAADPTLDLDGKKQAVRNAIDIYVEEIAGGRTQTNLGEIVDRALANAKRLTDEGKSRAARAALRKTAADLRRDEDDRRAVYEAGIKAVLGRERDIALASYDGDAAAESVVALADALGGNRRAVLIAEGDALEETGTQRGSNVHLVAAIAVRRAALALASGPDEVGADRVRLGNALCRLGEREGSTERLDEAVDAYRFALEEYTRDRVPLEWARTQNNLGNALCRLGERESSTEQLFDAVAAYGFALEEFTRDRVPLDWAGTQNNLGLALLTLGERESGTEQLKQAVDACGAALEEYTRDRTPLYWAMTQNNLGSALLRLGERESGIEQLKRAVAAYRAALEERTRDRVPLNWATTQNNLGTALAMLGERESGTERLEQAVAAYRAALEERTRDRVPLDWAMTQNNLGTALQTLGERESGTERLEQAVAAYRAALEERTRDRVPLDWAFSQHTLANALATLAERTHDRDRMTEAIASMRNAAEVHRQANNTYWLPIAERRIAAMEAALAEMPQ